MDASEDFESVFKEMMERGICSDSALLYELCAAFFELKENWKEAHMVYQIGILRCFNDGTFLEYLLAFIT